uniref:Uncharacterized protein n=1 Tax=Panagrolaimus sp. PS1159 TaxID=55785 RepID=A0AC35FR26_9BILA
MKLQVFFTFFIFVITFNEGAIIRERRDTSTWPSGAYCILQGSSGSCPPGFSLKSIRLSVQQHYKESESMGDGKKAVTIGSFGSSDLKSQKFDDAYILDLNTCCKDN